MDRGVPIRVLVSLFIAAGCGNGSSLGLEPGGDASTTDVSADRSGDAFGGRAGAGAESDGSAARAGSGGSAGATTGTAGNAGSSGGAGSGGAGGMDGGSADANGAPDRSVDGGGSFDADSPSDVRVADRDGFADVGVFDGDAFEDVGFTLDGASDSHGGASDADAGTLTDVIASPDVGGSDGGVAPDSGSSDADASVPIGVRLLVPLSTATVTSHRPTLHWALDVGYDGAHVDVCADRACANVVASFDASGTSSAVPVELSAGILFWRAHARSGSTTSVTATPVWQFEVGKRGAPVDTSWGATTDVDGDGWFDAVVGTYVAEVDVFLGVGQGGGPTQSALLAPDNPPGGFGNAVAAAGDVNGDGYADVVVGAKGGPAPPGEPGIPGRGYLYLGGATGLSTNALPMVAPDSGDGDFGSHVSGAGDINGDGYADVMISGIFGVTVYLGQAGGPGNAWTTLLADVENFDETMASAGDVNGDGYGDIVIGAQRTTANAGRAYVYLGGAAGLSSPIVLDSPEGENTWFGNSLGCAGDVNGDGYADIVVSSLSTSGSGARAYLYWGSASGPLPTPVVLAPTLSATSLGGAMTSAGDLNGDGYADVVVGDPNGRFSSGQIYVFFGGATGVTVPSVFYDEYPSGASSNGYGSAVVRAGDIDKDGYGDILIGAPGYKSSTGRITILYGSPTPVFPGRRTTLDPKMMGGGFAVSIAGG